MLERNQRGSEGIRGQAWSTARETVARPPEDGRLHRNDVSRGRPQTAATAKTLSMFQVRRERGRGRKWWREHEPVFLTLLAVLILTEGKEKPPWDRDALPCLILLRKDWNTVGVEIRRSAPKP